jgi:hypothetical protein
MTRVEVVIDQVVVSGLGPAEARHAVRAMDHRLLTLLADPTTRWPDRDTSVASLTPARTGSGRPGELGGAAAAAIHAALHGRGH